MIRKSLLVPILLLGLAAPVQSHKANGHSGVALPAIDSILYNPAVHKKTLSRNVIQAIGNRQAGQPDFIVHFRKKELHGGWQSFYNNGQRCDSGGFYRNLPAGAWKTWYPNGTLKTICTYSAAKYHYIKADLQRAHPKAWRYAITKQGNREAARYFKPNYGSRTSMPKSLSILQKIEHNTSGHHHLYLPPFAACLHHGAFVNYNETGAVNDSGHYENGLQHGLWKETADDAHSQAVGFYRHGVRHGQWKYYDSAGRLVYTERYKANGKRDDKHYFE